VTETVQATAEEVVSSSVELVLARFRLLARRRAAWLRHLWATEPEPLDALLADADAPDAEAAWVAGQSWTETWEAERQAVDAALAADTTSRLARLVQTFGLGDDERDLLQACLAAALDPSLARVCAYLHDHAGRPYLTQALVARLYGHGRAGVWSAESPLFRWDIVHERDAGIGEPRALALDEHVRDWLCDRDTLHEALVGIATLQAPRTPPASWPVVATVETLRRRLRAGDRTRVVVSGARGAGRRTFAAVAGAELGLPVLVVEADQVDDAHWRRVHLAAQRHAFLERCALAWVGESIAHRLWPATGAVFPLQFAIVDSGQHPAPVPGVIDHRVRLTPLTVTERSELWRQYVPAAGEWTAAEREALAERYRVHVGDIAAVAHDRVTTFEETTGRLREAARGRLGTLAQFLPCGFTWDDLVVAPALRTALEDIVHEAQHRGSFWERPQARRLFPQGQGLLALFSGPPGTGKTMAAQVLAGALGYDLFRVDLAAVVSKWVGETSQNFDRILTRAADMHAIVLFDECDAVFSKRTAEIRDAQDKFANTDAAFLLQAIETYSGVALLATNQKGNVDPAFIRRLRYMLEFTRPDAAQRLEIWRRAVTALADAARAGDLGDGLALLAEAVEATGAQIKYATLTAVFAAHRDGAPLGLVHLVRGLERELAKEGRTLSARDRQRIVGHAA
jgi:hypothetical protein